MIVANSILEVMLLERVLDYFTCIFAENSDLVYMMSEFWKGRRERG